MDSRFELVKVNEDGTSEYAASHEIVNTVNITFPEGYFDKGPPKFVIIPEFVVLTPEEHRAAESVNAKEQAAERRLTQLSLETSRMLSMPRAAREQDYGTQGPRLVMQALREAIDVWEDIPVSSR